MSNNVPSVGPIPQRLPGPIPFSEAPEETTAANSTTGTVITKASAGQNNGTADAANRTIIIRKNGDAVPIDRVKDYEELIIRNPNDPNAFSDEGTAPLNEYVPLDSENIHSYTKKDPDFREALSTFRKPNNEDTVKNLADRISFGSNGEMYLQYFDEKEKRNKITGVQVTPDFLVAAEKQFKQIEELSAKDKIKNMGKVIEDMFAGWNKKGSLEPEEALYLLARAVQADPSVANKFGKNPFDVNKKTQEFILNKIFRTEDKTTN